HKKNSLSRSTRPFGVFKPASLEHNRNCFRDEDPSGNKKDEGLMDQNSHDSERPSQSERACIPHEYLRRMTIVPQKTEPGPKHGGTKNRQFSSSGNERHFQVTRKL